MRLRAEAIEGNATVSYTILTSGKTAHVKVESATHPLFGEAAAAAVEQWLFKPGKVDGRVVNIANVIQFIEFKVNDEKAN